MTFCRTRLASAVLTSAAIIVALCAPPFTAAAQPNAQVHLANAPPIDRSQQRAHCDAQLRALKQSAGLADGQSDQAFMKTCLADVDPVAVLPDSAAVMSAPAGSTGVCKDGTYSSAVRRDGACTAHGGLSRWFGQ
jgi:hypothetical protein